MQNPAQDQIEAMAKVEILEMKPIFSTVLQTDGDIDMGMEVWINISPQDKTEDLRVSINIGPFNVYARF